ncbi:MAG: 2'-deoxycytidine 5'-triphosphate deaminase, partial [Terracidiphilus sp.]
GIGDVLTLECQKTYVFKLAERLHPKFEKIGIHGQATAKSSIGRVDVLARLIVDGMDQYERFSAEKLESQSGDMYLEVTPFTFRVNVKAGISLSQLRLFYGDPESVKVSGDAVCRTVFKESTASDASLSVNLENTTIGGKQVAAFCAVMNPNGEPINLWKEDPLADPCKYWKMVEVDGKGRLTIESDRFYILRSKEKIRVPAGIAIYCRASDETIGEMRIHYAGFVHPWFGERNDGEKGTPLIFEVRGHQVNVSLRHGERLANLTLYRMSADAKPENSDYGTQTLKLSGFFSEWPESSGKEEKNGTVEAEEKRTKG